MMGGVIYLAAAVALAALAAYFGLVGIPYRPDVMSAGTRVVGALFVVTIFVERSTAVLNSIWYGEARRLAQAHEALEMRRWLATIATPGESPPAALVAAINALARIESQQDQFPELETAVDQAIAACDGDPRAAVLSLIIANNYLTRELEYAWQLVSPGFSRQKGTRRKSTGSE